MEPSTLERIVLVAPVLLFSVIAHEYAHGFAALKQGDPTAYQLGRLTFNPAKHIDPFMTVVLPIMLYVLSGGRMALGGAKPVPVNPRNYRNFKRGDIIVSLAGVTANLAIAFACTGLIPLFGALGHRAVPLEPSFGILQAMMVFGVYQNLVLLAFNLLPIPPLDGSHVVKYLLPPAWSLKYQQIGRYGLFILVAMLGFGLPLLNRWIAPAIALAEVLISTVGGSLLPSARPWL